MALRGRTRIIQGKRSRTQYITISAVITQDSQYPFQSGEEVEIVVDPKAKKIEIRKIEDQEAQD